jgi:radical SAM superfamily enzyme YgiQ (UPF0313 family)
MAKILLTTDETLMSEYNNNEFLGFTACSPALIPERLFKLIFCPPVKSNGNGTAAAANCGVRKIEAALLENGFSEQDVAVVRPQDIDKFIDTETKVVGITTNDPLGLGPASTTFSDLVKKEPFSAKAFYKLIMKLKKYNVKIVVGGPGAWQLRNEKIIKKLGIDCVFIGEGEITGPKIFEQILNGYDPPKIVEGEIVPLEKIPNIVNPTINGIVEISRGCGRGCRFCNPTMLQFRCRPISAIIEEAKINVRAGKGVLLHGEDVLRYKAKGPIPNPPAVIKLFKEVRKLTPRIGISHFALASVLAKPKLIERLSDILELGSRKKPWISGQTGIETGSPRLAKKHLTGKALPFKADDWPQIVKDAHEILSENNWVPCSTLIAGMPGERAGDVVKTIELVEDLNQYKSLIIPLFFVPIGMLKKEKFFTIHNMLPEHWQLLSACIKHNFKWISILADEHFRMTRVPFAKRYVIKAIITMARSGLKKYIKLMDEGCNPFEN